MEKNWDEQQTISLLILELQCLHKLHYTYLFFKRECVFKSNSNHLLKQNFYVCPTGHMISNTKPKHKCCKDPASAVSLHYYALNYLSLLHNIHNLVELYAEPENQFIELTF